jgi:hypothetical protein
MLMPSNKPIGTLPHLRLVVPSQAPLALSDGSPLFPADAGDREHAVAADGWVSPFPLGHVQCPLTGEFSEAGRGDGPSVMFWVVVPLLCAAATGLGMGLWFVTRFLACRAI